MGTAVPATMSDLLNIFDDTLEHYQQNSANVEHQAEVAARLRQLRATMYDNLSTIADTFVQTMEAQPNLLRLNETQRDFIVFGDFHGSFTDLVKLQQKYQWREADVLTRLHFVFLGDYVDKGIHGFEVALYLMLRKLVFPESFTVIRGNHEVQWQNKNFFLKECQAKFEDGRDVWKTFNKCFSMLPYAAVLNSTVFCVHGGIPRMLDSLQEINTKIPKGLTSEMRHQVALQLLWNDFRTTITDRKRLYDPDDSEKEEKNERNISVRKYFIDNSERQIGCVVGHKAVRNFLRKHSLSYIVRAHQFDSVVKIQGYNTHSGNKVITVFSNSNYMGNTNATACVKVSQNSVDVIPLSPANHQSVRGEIFESEDLANLMTLHD